MNQIPLIFLGVFAAIATSFWGLLIVPQSQIGQLESARVDNYLSGYPRPRTGLASQGAETYRANGCVECHTLQVRSKTQGTDIQRGWGTRRTIAQDYLLESPVQLGSVRLGPDLTNVGRRQSDSLTLLRKLYNPRLVSEGSLMPRYEYLFTKRKLVGDERASKDALPRDTEPGYEIVPKPEAIALVAYLQSLVSDAPLFSAPVLGVKTNRTSTAAPAKPSK